MGTLKCLACGHENKAGDEACASCATSLNVKLCASCEAINAANAEKCHACGAELRPEPASAAAQETVEVIEEMASRRPLASMHDYAWQRKTAVGVRRAGALMVFVLVFIAGGAAYHVWMGMSSSGGATQSISARVVQQAQSFVEQRSAAAPAQPQAAPAPSTAVPAKTVTHTRLGAAVPPAPITEPQPTAEITKRKPTAPAPRAAPPMAKIAPIEATAAVAVVPALPAVISESSHTQVTHTRRGAASAEMPVTKSEAGATVAPAEPAKSAGEPSSGCAPGVAALGLCKQ